MAICYLSFFAKLCLKLFDVQDAISFLLRIMVRAQHLQDYQIDSLLIALAAVVCASQLSLGLAADPIQRFNYILQMQK